MTDDERRGGLIRLILSGLLLVGSAGAEETRHMAVNLGELGDEAESSLAEKRARRLRSSAGIWKNRDDLPDCDSLRRSWNREYTKPDEIRG